MSFDRFKWERNLWETEERTSVKAVGCYLRMRADRIGKCFPTITEIADRVKMDRKTARKSVDRLIEIGFVSTVILAQGRVVYTLMGEESTPTTGERAEESTPTTEETTEELPEESTPSDGESTPSDGESTPTNRPISDQSQITVTPQTPQRSETRSPNGTDSRRGIDSGFDISNSVENLTELGLPESLSKRSPIPEQMRVDLYHTFVPAFRKHGGRGLRIGDSRVQLQLATLATYANPNEWSVALKHFAKFCQSGSVQYFLGTSMSNAIDGDRFSKSENGKKQRSRIDVPEHLKSWGEKK